MLILIAKIVFLTMIVLFVALFVYLWLTSPPLTDEQLKNIQKKGFGDKKYPEQEDIYYPGGGFPTLMY
jgi:hypothetical protein